MIFFQRHMPQYVRLQNVFLEWNIIEYRSLVESYYIRDVSQRCVPVKEKHLFQHFRHILMHLRKKVYAS